VSAMRTMMFLGLSACLSVAASAQDVGYLSPRGGVAFVADAGVPFTTVDFSHPATAAGALTTATVRWAQAPTAGCTNAMKLKIIRPVPNPFGSFFVVAERGPFNVVNGFDTVDLSPAVSVDVGDYLAVVQLRGDPCGGMAITATESSSRVFQYSSDLASGTFAGGLLRSGIEFGARASAAPSVLTSIVPAVGSTHGAFGSNFKTSMQLTNATPYPAKGTLVFHPAGRSAQEGDPSLQFSLSNFQTVFYDDVVAQMGQSGLGSLDVMSTSSAAPIATVRVYNDGGTAGTSSFTEDVLPPEAALQFGEITLVTIPADLTNFRLNIGVRSLSAGVTLFVSAVDKDGFGSPSVMKTYSPNVFEQTSVQSFLNGTSIPAGGSISIIVSTGSAFVYGSTTDNRTNDSNIQLAARR
jgi:hypothetical protein